MKVIAIFFCILTGVFFTLETYGQKKEKESYKSFKLRSSSKDIDQLLSEAEALKLKNPRQALTKVQEALGMSLTQEDVFNEGRCYLLLGEINEKIDEWDLARENYQQAHQKLSGNFTSSPEFLKALKGLGDANLKLGNHEAALQNYQEALKLRLRSTEKKAAERQKIQREIQNLNKLRQEYISKNTPNKKSDAMLDAAMIKAVKAQAKAKKS